MNSDKTEKKNDKLEFNTYCIFTEEKQEVKKTVGLIFKDYIENFLKLEQIDKIYLYRLINKIEIDKNKNVYIYFNFSKLKSINENLEEFIEIEELINEKSLKNRLINH